MIGGSDDVAGGHCRLVEFGSHVGNRDIERADAVGEAGADGKLAAIDGGIGAAHRFGCQAAVGGDQAAEFGVEPIDIGLDGGAGALGQRLMGVAVDLLVAGEHEAPRQAGLGVGPALVDMNRDHADRSEFTGARDVEPVGGAGDGIGRRQRAFVGDRPERFAAGGFDRADALDQIEQAADLAAGRVDVEDDAAHRRIVHGGGNGVADVAVGQEAA